MHREKPIRTIDEQKEKSGGKRMISVTLADLCFGVFESLKHSHPADARPTSALVKE